MTLGGKIHNPFSPVKAITPEKIAKEEEWK